MFTGGVSVTSTLTLMCKTACAPLTDSVKVSAFCFPAMTAEGVCAQELCQGTRRGFTAEYQSKKIKKEKPGPCVRTHCRRWQHKWQVTVFIAESCHRFLNTLAMNTLDVLAVAVFTGCYCSEAALVPPLFSSLCHCLSFTISPPCSLFVISLTHLFTQLFCLCHLCFSSPTRALAVLLLLTCRRFSLPPSLLSLLLEFSSWITPERSRNRAGCQPDERGHAGPAEPVMLSHHKASLSLSLSPSQSLTRSLVHMHI